MNKDMIKALVGGLFVGATVGVIVRFATDGKTLKYAGTGAVIGAATYAIILATKKAA